MSLPVGTRRRGVRARAGGRVLAVLVLGAAATWAGCAVTKSNYKCLSFFFDGVPNPDEAGTGGHGGGEGGQATVVVHRPFEEQRCDECHRTMSRPSRNDSTMCLQCHSAVQSEHPLMHGPVVATACLWCHSPHESAHAHLLLDKDRNVCSQCHIVAQLNTDRTPAHGDAGRACLECHSGHGSSVPFLIREESVGPPAPTPPAPPPAEPGAPVPSPAPTGSDSAPTPPTPEH